MDVLVGRRRTRTCPSASSASTWSSAASDRVAPRRRSSSPTARQTCGRARASRRCRRAASRRSNGRLTVSASSSSAGPSAKRPCQSVLPPGVSAPGSSVSGSMSVQSGEVAEVRRPAPRRRVSARRRTSGCRRRRRCRAARRCRLRSSAEATTCAHPGGVRRTTRLPRARDLGHPLAHHPPQLVVGRDARSGSYSGIA